MERPAKRMRLWKPQASASSTTERSGQPTPSRPAPLAPLAPQEPILPTRTIDLSDFRRRAFHAYRSADGHVASRKRNGVIYLMPRAPVATVTAKMLVIAVDEDGTEPKIMATVKEPTTESAVSIGTLGTLTLPGLDGITSGIGSLISSLGGISTTTAAVGSGSTNLPNSASANGTTVASGENTATISMTSTITVSYRNGTFIPPLRTTAAPTASSDGSSSSETTSTAEDATNTITSGSDLANGVAPSTTNGNNGLVVAGTTSSPRPTETGSSGGSGVALTPQQQQVVGGVVGGVAGVALVLVALLYFLKWYRQRLKGLGRLPEPSSTRPNMVQSGGDTSSPNSQALVRSQPAETPRSSIGPIAAVATRLRQLRPYSTNTVSTASNRDSLPSGSGERSFQRVAGRKIPTVLFAGGDGYGDSYGAFERTAHRRGESQTSIYGDDLINASSIVYPQRSSMSEPATPTRSDPFADPPSIERMQQNTQRSFSPTPNFSRPSYNRDLGSPGPRSQSSFDYRSQFSPVLSPAEGFATLRPSPARTPMTQSPTVSTVHLPQPRSTPPLMAGYVPDLPTVPTLNLPPKRKTNRMGRGRETESAVASRFDTRTARGVGEGAYDTNARLKDNAV